MSAAAPAPGGATAGHGVPFAEAVRVWLRVAALSFGGPAGQIALMHRVLVEERRWVSEARFLHALGYCTLLPGPEAQQLATYVGWLMHRTRGGVVAGGLFVLPGFLSILALSWVYVLYGNVGPVAAAFFGLKAAVVAIVLQAVPRVGRRALRNRVLLGVAVAAFASLFLFGVPFPLVVLAAGVAGYVGARAGSAAFAAAPEHGGGALEEGTPEHARPDAARAVRTAAVWLALWLVPVVLVLLVWGWDSTPGRIAVFFSQMAVVTFGGAYAVLAYVAQQAVEHYAWLRPGEMLDGLALAETTPGPLIMVVQFVGFLAAYRDPGALPPLLAATAGAVLTTWVTFAPCFLWVFLGGPYVEALRGQRALNGALAAITAAVVGVIANLALWFALHALFREQVPVAWGPLRFDLPVPGSVDPALLALSVLATVVLARGASVFAVLGGCALAGVLLHAAGFG